MKVPIVNGNAIKISVDIKGNFGWNNSNFNVNRKS